jgi:hypothetical protein
VHDRARVPSARRDVRDGERVLLRALRRWTLPAVRRMQSAGGGVRESRRVLLGTLRADPGHDQSRLHESLPRRGRRVRDGLGLLLLQLPQQRVRDGRLPPRRRQLHGRAGMLQRRLRWRPMPSRRHRSLPGHGRRLHIGRRCAVLLRLHRRSLRSGPGPVPAARSSVRDDGRLLRRHVRRRRGQGAVLRVRVRGRRCIMHTICRLLQRRLHVEHGQVRRGLDVLARRRVVHDGHHLLHGRLLRRPLRGQLPGDGALISDRRSG